MRFVGLLRSPLTLVLLAAGAGLLWPSEQLASRADVLLAALVFAVTLTIAPGRLWAARRTWPRTLLLVLLPLATLLPVSVGLGQLFDDVEREGLLSLGLSSTEVATVALAAIAAGDAALALLVCVFSLIATAAAAPLIAPWLTESEIGSGEILLRFSLVVLVPLALGLLVGAFTRPARLERQLELATSVILALLVYAALGELDTLSGLGPAALAALAFLAAAILITVPLLLAGERRTTVFVFPLRDFAVAVALANQLERAGAATTTAVYGVLMLILATAAASVLRRRADRS